MAALVRALALLAFFVVAGRAGAMPAVLVGQGKAERVVHAAHVIVVRHAGYSIVTVMADYEGPLSPFAFLVPVPADVSARDVKTVKRGILRRVEQVSAPRFHAFYEQDPCDRGVTEQRWQEHVRARGRGFLTPPGVPPLDQHYSVSNEIATPIAPVFKGAENEFRYQARSFAGLDELRSFVLDAGYSIADSALSALSPYLGRGMQLLVAEVTTERVELGKSSRIQLGGIRFVTRKPVALPVGLGRESTRKAQDLFVYVLDRESRFEARDYSNVFPPASVRVLPRAADSLARVYDGLFEATLEKARGAFVSEYAWSTAGCGEPCPDVPLGMDELMTLGGDVLEAKTTTARERAAPPAGETGQEQARFEAHIAELAPAQRSAARREHARDLAEIGRRRALMARQTFVLSRLHYRSGRGSAPLDRELVLVPAAPVNGGAGVPRGPTGELSRAARQAPENAFQVRFHSLERWSRGVACASPEPFRWGKPWTSEARTPRAVPLATDLEPRIGNRALLREVLVHALPEVGVEPSGPREEFGSAPAPAGSSAKIPPPAPVPKASGCAFRRAPADLPDSAWLGGVVLAWLVARVSRQPRRGAPWQPQGRTPPRPRTRRR